MSDPSACDLSAGDVSATTPDVLTSARLHEMWTGSGPAEEAGDAGEGPPPAASFATGLLARVCGDPGAGIEWLSDALLEVQRLTSAERVFFFDTVGFASERPSGGGEASATEIGQCLLALDFDRETIPNPEAKIPMRALAEAVGTGAPVFSLDAVESGGPGQPRGSCIVPLVVSGVCHGVIYVDHRFQPLRIADGACLVALWRAIAVRYALDKITRENRSLWADLLAQRRKTKEAESLAERSASPAARGGRKSSKPRRFEGDYSKIISVSPAMEEVFSLLDRIRTSTAPVLINGESGTGKELIANAIHVNGPRSAKAFVSENCGALTETLLESELFGYVKGAFTGAASDRKGLFELADGGTLFLDEVGDMSPSMQKKLLRALQEGVVRRVGGKEYISVDVRIISATNKDLLQEVRKGSFREDLYYRLNVINVKLPPLRERREDVPELVMHFLAEIEKEGGEPRTVSPQALQLLTRYDWPGNIRELQNEVKRLHALSDGRIEVSQLSETIRRGEGMDLLSSALEDELRSLTLREALEKVERALIKRALVAAEGNKSRVAKRLQIPKTSLYNKISKYRLDEEVQGTLG